MHTNDLANGYLIDKYSRIATIFCLLHTTICTKRLHMKISHLINVSLLLSTGIVFAAADDRQGYVKVNTGVAYGESFFHQTRSSSLVRGSSATLPKKPVLVTLAAQWGTAESLKPELSKSQIAFYAALPQIAQALYKDPATAKFMQTIEKLDCEKFAVSAFQNPVVLATFAHPIEMADAEAEQNRAEEERKNNVREQASREYALDMQELERLRAHYANCSNVPGNCASVASTRSDDSGDDSDTNSTSSWCGKRCKRKVKTK
jgi:hypothetical protein